MRMNYTWRILKYSKIIQREEDKSSYCKKDLDHVSQTVTHSQYDTQEIHKEDWLHIFSQGNKLLEVSVTAKTMEIKLLIHSPPNIEVTVLEHLTISDRVAMCVKQRVLGCKFTECQRKFQITFFNSQEVNLFMDKFNEMFCIKHVCSPGEDLVHKFLSIVGDGEVEKVYKKKTKKSKTHLLNEFLRIIKEK